MIKILDGVKVLEQGTFITGPATAMLLGDLGADVIKIEEPTNGDPFRAFKGSFYSPHYQTYNRNKRSITLNTKLAADREVFDELVRTADVYIQNFRPGVASRLSVDAERLLKINPRLVYCSISGFGASGPGATRPAYDTIAQAASGLLALMTNPADPRIVGPAIADAITALYASQGVLAALFARERKGVGSKVEISMLEALTHFNLDAFTHYFSAGEVMGPFSRPDVSSSYIFECADGKWIALHLSSPDKFWHGLARATGCEELVSDVRFALRASRITHQGEVIALLKPVFAGQARAYWCERLLENDVPHSPVYDVTDALEDPQAKHLSMIVRGEHREMGSFTTLRSPLNFDGLRADSVVPPPTLGEHNAEIVEPIRRRLAGRPN